MAKVKSTKVAWILSDRENEFRLKVVSGKEGLERTIKSPDIHRPGLALAGYLKFFPKDRIQVLGKNEIAYLNHLGKKELEAALSKLSWKNIPCMIVTNSQPVPAVLRRMSDAKAVPILVTALETGTCIRVLTEYLGFALASERTVHATLVDVFGMGLLLTGAPGIGKSEAALALVERGHRLVADDTVKIVKQSNNILIGSCCNPPEAGLSHHMEIKGVGLVDVYAIYGITAIRLQKRVEVEVELVKWTHATSEVRLGMEEETTDIMGVKIPYLHIPLVPGKNVAILCEVVARNQLLKVWGYNPAVEFDEKLIRLMGGHEEMDWE